MIMLWDSKVGFHERNDDANTDAKTMEIPLYDA